MNYSGQWRTNKEISFNQISTQFTYQPSNALQLSLLPSFSVSKNKLQYVTSSIFNNNSRYIVAEIKQSTLTFPLRIDYIIKPNLSMQYWGQPYISRGIYDNYKYITNPTANNFDDRYTSYTNDQISFDTGTYSIDENLDKTNDYFFLQPDFSFVQWRSNLVLLCHLRKEEQKFVYYSNTWYFTSAKQLFII